MKQTMKRITLWMIAMLMAMTSFAQDPETVTAPDGLLLEEYALKARTYTTTDDGYVYSDVTQSLFVGTDGTDVYIRGLCEYLPMAYIKGTKNGTKVTFAGGQYLGKLYANGELFEFYFGGTTEDFLTSWEKMWPLTDVEFTIDETTGTMTTDSWMVINSDATTVLLPYAVTLDNSIVKVTDVAATPATPSITYVYDIDPESSVNYGGIYMTIPTLDTNGNALLTEKLSYRLFTAAGDDVQPYVIKADEHEFIDEDMTEIPYTFTDDWDIEYAGAAIYFYTPLSGFDKIGVQSIYRGGNEENNSEIFWYDLKSAPVEEELEGATFDFNALDKETTPVSSNQSTAGDITTDQMLTADGVKMTISPNDGTPANRYWVEYNKQVIQLRLYGGSLTFEAPEGSTIQKIGFYNDTWNPGNYTWDGTLTGGDGMALWEGDAETVVLYLGTGGGGSGNTKLNKVVVVLNTPDGIRTVDLQPATDVRYFDLQGREVPASTKGLLIQQQRMADGTMKSVKIVR